MTSGTTQGAAPRLRRNPLATATWFPTGQRLRSGLATILLAGYLVLVFAIPTRLVFPPLGAAGRPAVIAGLGLLLLWLNLALVRRALPAGTQPVRWIVGGYVATQLIGFVAGYHRGLPGIEARSADRWMIVTTAMMGVVFCFADGPKTRRHLDLLLLTLLALGSCSSLVGLMQFSTGLDLQQYVRIPGLQPNIALLEIGERGTGDVARVSGFSSHYIEFGVVLALLVPLAIHMALYARSSAQRALRWGMLVVIVVGIPLSVSRSGIVALLVGIGVLAIVWSWRMRYNALVVALAGAVLFRAVSPGVLGTLRALFVSAEQDPSVQGRTEDYNIVFPMIAEDLWVGRGAGTFIPENYILLDNQLLNTLVSTGVLGLLGFLALFLGGMGVTRSIRRRAAHDEDRHLAQALCGSLAAAIVASATFDSFSFIQFTCMVFILLGLVGALWRLSGTRPWHPAVSERTCSDRTMPPTWRDLR